MTTLKEDLWNTLEDLTDEQFKQFQWFLKGDIPKGFLAIAVARLEGADRQDTVDLIVQKYGCPGALEITINILEKISRNDLVQRLKENRNLPNKSDNERKKAKLGETKAEIKLMIQERQMKIWEIKQSSELSSKSAGRHIAESVQVFADLQQSVERSLANLIEAIEEKREATRKQAEGFIQELEREISELTKRSSVLEQLSRTEDHLDFACLNAFPPTKTWTAVSIPPPSYGESVGTAVKKLEEKLCKEIKQLIAKAKLNRVQQFEKDVTLDPDTANPFLILSDDGKKVYCGEVKQNHPDNPERFNPAINVLGKQSFSSGRFYYEVQVKGKTSWNLGVVRKSIARKGSIKPNPENGYWTICLRKGKYQDFAVSLSVKYPVNKVGVFVDYEKGSVSFYDVDSAELIHCFTGCSFTERLYPFFSPGLHDGGRNSTPLIISPVNYTDKI